MTEQPTGVGSSLWAFDGMQVKHGAGRLFFICISLIKSMAEPTFT